MEPNDRILIVDDEPFNIKLLKATLSTVPYRTLTACNGEEALKKVNEEPPDLILLDVMMPGMDGYEVT
jgi:CheY-like chemotaxis protein